MQFLFVRMRERDGPLISDFYPNSKLKKIAVQIKRYAKFGPTTKAMIA